MRNVTVTLVLTLTLAHELVYWRDVISEAVKAQCYFGLKTELCERERVKLEECTYMGRYTKTVNMVVVDDI